MTPRITFALAASAGMGMMVYILNLSGMSESNVAYMIGGWVAFAISAVYMPDKEDK